MLLLVLLGSCARQNEQKDAYDFIKAKFHVTDVYKAKYSRVEGYVVYKGILLYTSNGGSGYYYKDYNLNKGNVIDVDVTIYLKPYRNGMFIYAGDLDLNKFEINQN